MRFYHLSDILIGNNFESGMRWEDMRSREIMESLESLLLKAEAEGVRLILITGGLFAHPPVTGELANVSALFAAHPRVETVVTAGLSDALSVSSPILSFEPPANLHFVLGPGVERITLRDAGVEIYAASARTGSDGKVSFPGIADFVRALESAQTPSIRIAMLPEFSNQEIADSSEALSAFSYLAAAGGVEGVSHEIVRDRAYRPGHFEPKDTSDRGAHGAMLGDISEESGVLSRIDFVPLAHASYVTLNIKVTPQTDAAGIEDALSREMARRRSSNIYRLRITGEKDPGMEPDLERLKSDYRIREIIDESVPRYDYASLYHEHSEDMIGFYISSILSGKGEMSALEKKAMYYGLDALIRTADRDKEV